MTDVPPLTFSWEPGPDRRAAFDSLKDEDGKYLCPWPNCTGTSPAPQGMARHMTYHHDWQSPWAHQHSRKKSNPRYDRPTAVKVSCGYNGCTRKIRLDYKRDHLRRYHHLTENVVEGIMARNGNGGAVAVVNNQPRDFMRLLGAEEVCQAVLEQVAHNDLMPVAAVPAYLQWMRETHAFLTTLYGKEP